MSSTTWESARDVVWHAGRTRPLAAEPVPVDRADGRTLADAVHARVDLPTVDVSAMDGWAVAGAGPWQLDGAVAMGAPPAWPLRVGMARVITTGAAVPPGAVGVLRAEHGDLLPELHGWLRPIAPAALAGRDIRRRGEELRRGEPLIPVGARMTPPRLALAAAAGGSTRRDEEVGARLGQQFDERVESVGDAPGRCRCTDPLEQRGKRRSEGVAHRTGRGPTGRDELVARDDQLDARGGTSAAVGRNCGAANRSSQPALG